jgi:hypothetical protein
MNFFQNGETVPHALHMRKGALSRTLEMYMPREKYSSRSSVIFDSQIFCSALECT